MVTMGSFIDKFPFLETTYLTYHNGSNVCGNNTILGKISTCWFRKHCGIQYEHGSS